MLRYMKTDNEDVAELAIQMTALIPDQSFPGLSIEQQADEALRKIHEILYGEPGVDGTRAELLTALICQFSMKLALVHEGISALEDEIERRRQQGHKLEFLIAGLLRKRGNHERERGTNEGRS